VRERHQASCCEMLATSHQYGDPGHDGGVGPFPFPWLRSSRQPRGSHDEEAVARVLEKVDLATVHERKLARPCGACIRGFPAPREHDLVPVPLAGAAGFAWSRPRALGLKNGPIEVVMARRRRAGVSNSVAGSGRLDGGRSHFPPLNAAENGGDGNRTRARVPPRTPSPSPKRRGTHSRLRTVARRPGPVSPLSGQSECPRRSTP
jgi:hypothetical protein